MANWYILAYHDELSRLRLFPEVIHVNPGDNVIWASNVNEQYVAGDFSSSQLFPQPSYNMPANNQSAAAQVQVAPGGSTPYLYRCTQPSGTAAGDGDSGSGIIIVDPPGGDPGSGKGKREHQPAGATKKKGR